MLKFESSSNYTSLSLSLSLSLPPVHTVHTVHSEPSSVPRKGAKIALQVTMRGGAYAHGYRAFANESYFIR